jgi:hypothetical protein
MTNLTTSNVSTLATSKALTFSTLEVPMLTITEFNSSVRLFPNAETSDIFASHSQFVLRKVPIPRNCNGLVANLLLYFTDEALSSSLNEPSRIELLFREAETLLRFGCKCLHGIEIGNSNINSLLQSLNVLKNIFESFQIQAEHLPAPKVLSLAFTDIEQSWLNNQVKTKKQNIRRQKEVKIIYSFIN